MRNESQVWIRLYYIAVLHLNHSTSAPHIVYFIGYLILFSD